MTMTTTCPRERAIGAARSAWRRAGRVAAWLLVPLMLLQFVSGYAIMHPRILGGVMGKMTAFRVHGILQPLTVTAFVVHGLPWIRRRLAKEHVAGLALDVVLTLLGVALVAASLYLFSLG